MLFDLRRLFNQTVIYGLGDFLNRIASFILLPLYTNYLTPSEFGQLELLLVTSTIISMFLGRQLAHGTLRFYFEYKESSERKRLVSTTFLFSAFFSGIILAIFSTKVDYFSELLFNTARYDNYFLIIFLIIFFELSNEIFFAYIRAQERPVLFVSINFISLIIKLTITIYLVVLVGTGIQGVLLGSLSGVVLTWLILGIYSVVSCGLHFDKIMFLKVFRYIYPLIFVGFLGMFIRNADRFFLNSYASLATVGIYAFAFRIKSVLNFLIINPFTRGYGPYRFSIMRMDGANIIYARVTTYFLFVLVWCALSLSVISKEVLFLFCDISYYPAYLLVPILMISGIMEGLYYMFQTGLYIQKTTGILAKISFVSVILHAILLTTLVPHYLAFGASISLSITSMFSLFSTLYFSQKSFYIPYEWLRISKVLIVGIILFLISTFVELDSNLLSLYFKLLFILLYPLFLFVINLFNKEEKKEIYRLFHKYFFRRKKALDSNL